MKNKNHDYLDKCKFILSLMVAAIHVNPLGVSMGSLRFPLTRIAVPIFFLISGYFLFDKLQNCANKAESKHIVSKFVKRNVYLYFTWFIFLLPVTVYNRKYYTMTFGDWIVEFCIDLLFGSTFSASWYIMALVIGVLIINLLSNHFGNRSTLIFGFIAYILCCLTSNYRRIFADNSIIGQLEILYPTTMCNSFPAALLWLMMGKCISENKKVYLRISCTCLSVVGFAGIIGLVVEHLLIQKWGCSVTNDCYFMLIPVCAVLFLMALRTERDVPYARIYRQLSTIIYCAHIPVSMVVGFAFRRFFGIDTGETLWSMALYSTVIVLCGMLYIVIKVLQKNRLLTFLQYTY